MQIAIDKEPLEKLLKVTLYVFTGADYAEIGETVNELLDKIGYTELPDNYGRLIDANTLTPDTEWDDYNDGFMSYSQLQIDSAPTILEAKEQSE